MAPSIPSKFLLTPVIFYHKGSVTEPLSIDNTMWCNTVLASGSVVVLVVYTGRETRAVMNTSFPATKIGLLDLEINRLSKVMFLKFSKFDSNFLTQILAAFTVVLSFVMIALDGFKGNWGTDLGRFLILFSSIIPIR